MTCPLGFCHFVHSRLSVNKTKNHFQDHEQRVYPSEHLPMRATAHDRQGRRTQDCVALVQLPLSREVTLTELEQADVR